ncbi:MAG: MATE family efflux transporter [Caloramator sp.]|nr:MATE family efflux transporter [Caloramator sp.]
MRDLTKGNEIKQIVYFAIPMLLGNLLQTLYNTVDSIWVGKGVGEKGLAAVTVSFPILFMLISLIMGVTMGSSIIISQYFGAKDYDNVKKSINTTLYFLLISSAVVTILGVVVSKPVLILINTPKAILNEANKYLIIMFLGMVFMFGYNGVAAILRGMGDSKTPLYFLMIATVINIILDPVFIFVFKLGVVGAAVATVIAQAVSFIFSVNYINKKHELFKIRLDNIKSDKEILKKIIKIGIPMGVQQTLVSLAMVFLNSIINVFGVDAMAAFGAAGRIDSFMSMPIMSLSAAVSSFTGQNLGANKKDRVVKGFRGTLLIGVLLSIIIASLAIIFARPLICIFNSKKEVVAFGVDYLKIVGMFYFTFAFMFIVSGVVRGSGDTMVPMITSLIALWGIRVPLAQYLSSRIGIEGVWWSIGIGWVAGSTLNYIYYRTGRWEKKVVVKT